VTNKCDKNRGNKRASGVGVMKSRGWFGDGVRGWVGGGEVFVKFV